MSGSRKLTIPVEGVSHSEERGGGKERPKEMHKVVWRSWRFWIARALELLRTNGFEDHPFSLPAYRKVMYVVTNLRGKRTVPFMLVEALQRSSQTILGQK